MHDFFERLHFLPDDDDDDDDRRDRLHFFEPELELERLFLQAPPDNKPQLDDDELQLEVPDDEGTLMQISPELEPDEPQPDNPDDSNNPDETATAIMVGEEPLELLDPQLFDFRDHRFGSGAAKMVVFYSKIKSNIYLFSK